MYREPHLQCKSDQCRDLWWVWKELWDVDMYSEETKEARQNWSECVSEFNKMISQEVETNPRYHGIRM
jgi:hypothetical protein